MMLSPLANAATLTVGIDLSGSSPVFDEQFARPAGQHVAKRVAALSIGDRLVVRTFGARSLINVRQGTMAITRSNRPQEVAAQAAALVANVPSAGIEPQGSTNVIAFLEFGEFDCAQGGQIILVTDGIEASSYSDPDALLSGKAKLPDPTPGFLSGCSITFYGLGAGQSAQAAKNIRDAWRKWFDAAGASFTAVMP
jgi:hypothetical protein